MTLDLSPLDRAIAAGVVPADERDAIVAALMKVPEPRRERTLDRIVASHRQARQYVDNMLLDIVKQNNGTPKEPAASSRRKPHIKRHWNRARMLQKAERALREAARPELLKYVRGTEAHEPVRKLFRRIIDECEKGLEFLR